jgi:hypothetical protein
MGLSATGAGEPATGTIRPGAGASAAALAGGVGLPWSGGVLDSSVIGTSFVAHPAASANRLQKRSLVNRQGAEDAKS